MMSPITIPHSPEAAGDAPMSGSDDALFEDAPSTTLQKRLGLIRPDDRAVRRRAMLVILAGWLPLLLLAVAQSVTTRTDIVTPLVGEVGLHARYLIAAPLLVLAEAVSGPQLNAIIRHFRDGSFMVEGDRARMAGSIASTRALLRSRTAEGCVFGLAYLITLGTLGSHPADQLPVWAAPVGVLPLYSPAGWWHTVVSLPLLLVLILGWVWRIALWTRLLWHISRLELRLVASHPDRCAGLSFVGHSIRALAPVAFAMSTIAAGRSAHALLAGGDLPTPYLVFNVIWLLSVAAVLIAPLLLFGPTLLVTWRRGVFAYDALAETVGRAFEQRWLSQAPDKDARDPADFSAAADLYAVVANVHAMQLAPVGLKDLVALAVALLLPFVPVLLLAVPRDVILDHLGGLLF